MKLPQRLLRLFLPGGERVRMEMREARQRACASAEDLTRTLIMDGGKIQEMIKKRRMNGKDHS